MSCSRARRRRAGVGVHAHGNNKSLAELRLALTAGVRYVAVDSFDEPTASTASPPKGCHARMSCYG